MFQQLTNKQRRYLAIEFFVLVVLLMMWLVVVPLWTNTQSSLEEVDELRFRLAKYEQAIKHTLELKKEQAALKKQLTQVRLFHSGGVAPGVVAATVQSTIRKAVEKSEGSLISTHILAEKKGEQFTRISISLRLTGSDQVLQKLLYELETSQPLLLVEKVVIHSKRRPHSPNPLVTPLNITLEVASYLALNKGS